MINESIGMYYRITTNGTMRNYRSDLMRSRGRLNDAMEKVLTHRQFNSFAEDPAAASRAFQLRRSIGRTQDQIENVQTLERYNQMAFLSLDAICDGTVDSPGLNGLIPTLRAANDPEADSRKALGKEILAECDSIVMNMNVRYGDNYVFSGADGLNVPFTWDGNKLLFRGVDVSSAPLPDKTLEDFGGDAEALAAYQSSQEAAKADHEKLVKFSNEKGYVDIGMGMQLDENGEFIETTGYPGYLNGIDYIGFGVDEDGDPNNIVLLMQEAGQILSRCSEDSGKWASDEDRARFDVLLDKITDRTGEISEKHVQLSAETTFLQTTEIQLKQRNDYLDEQREEIESIDPADAITQMAWANYCYQAALKIGNQVLSQSLLDYMN